MAMPRLARIDRRYIYLLLFLLVSLPFFYPLKLPLSVGEHAQAVFDVTEALPADSVVISSFDFGPSTITENKPQCKAHLYQCKERGLKVVALAFWISGGPLGEIILREVYGEEFPNIPDYGTKVVYLGYVPGNEVGMQTFGDSTVSAKGTDHYGTPVGELDLMNEVTNAADFDLWAEWTSGTPGEQQVIQFVQGRHGGPSAVPIVVGSTAVSVPGMMPFYAAGQISGIMNGLSGGGQYELLVDEKYGYPLVEALPLLDSQSVAHVLIIVFVIIGNIGFAIAKYGGGQRS